MNKVFETNLSNLFSYSDFDFLNIINTDYVINYEEAYPENAYIANVILLLASC